MRNPERLHSFYDELKRIHSQHVPDWRFAQLIDNVFRQIQSEGRDPFFFEEDEFLRYLKRYFGEENEEGKNH
jgi:hypothetical protein